MLNYLSKSLGGHNYLIEDFDKFFPKGRTTSSKFVCVDYVPISTFCGPLCFCVVERECDSYNVVFKPSFSSTAKATNILHNFNISASTTLSTLRHALNALESSDYTDEWLSNVRTFLDTQNFEFLQNYFEDTRQCPLAEMMNAQTSELVKTLAYISLPPSQDVIQTLKKICNTVIKLIEQYSSQPDTLEELLAYAALSAGNLEGEYKLIYIPELSAVNIITPRLSELQKNPADYDKHMLFANFEMLNLFTYKLRPGCYKFPPQNTLASLTEFVPIAAKFKDIYNPLFDNKQGIWESLCKNYKWLKNIECCTNKCNAAGFRIDSSSEVYDPGEPDTYNLGRIYYTLCCNIDQAFNREQTPITPVADGADGIKYTTDLAAALIFRMLVNEGLLRQDDYNGRVAWYEDASSHESYVAACTAQSPVLYSGIYNRASQTDFVLTMIYRTLLKNNKTFDHYSIIKDASLMQQQFSSITINTFGGL